MELEGRQTGFQKFPCAPSPAQGPAQEKKNTASGTSIVWFVYIPAYVFLLVIICPGVKEQVPETGIVLCFLIFWFVCLFFWFVPGFFPHVWGEHGQTDKAWVLEENRNKEHTSKEKCLTVGNLSCFSCITGHAKNVSWDLSEKRLTTVPRA